MSNEKCPNTGIPRSACTCAICGLPPTPTLTQEPPEAELVPARWEVHTSCEDGIIVAELRPTARIIAAARAAGHEVPMPMALGTITAHLCELDGGPGGGLFNAWLRIMHKATALVLIAECGEELKGVVFSELPSDGTPVN